MTEITDARVRLEAELREALGLASAPPAAAEEEAEEGAEESARARKAKA